ncbi:MetQ/NlpA family ABC transporter substrate-binding protein [Terriglobus roseus]|uniref:Lipoprotein, YaeC family n=1 Tax=Terriglobus roseus TaxID=392734 RepID=A0A1G7HH10_9BACT|nr:MetQ/NlpA family ABC transporter substrate-binding protein [Terriglobus roseus]SDE99770.1 lipoprotein, YaeC family [Terriglobus roseus]
MKNLLALLWEPTLQTLYMVGIAVLLSGVGGLFLGIALVTTAPGRILQAPWLYRVLNVVTNVGRSVPFIILLVAILPFTRWLIGTAIGTSAAIVPLVVGAIPYVARLVESSLLEVDYGVIEAVLTMGATPWQVIRKTYLPEAVPALIRSMTIVTITLISYSAMAGAIGGGGLGDLAIRYGYQGFRADVMLATVIVLVLLIQTVQFVGDSAARHFQHTEPSARKKSIKQGLPAIVGSAVLLLGAAGGLFHSQRPQGSNRPLRVGVNPVPHGEILQAALPLLKRQGLDVEIVSFNDYVQPNLALVSGDIDANYFQHVPFMENFNHARNAHVVSVGKIHIEPLGIYAGRSRSLNALPEHAIITVPNDPANSGRALLLLQAADLLQLRTGSAVGATVQDISQNPKHVQIRLLEAAQLPRSLQDANVAVINMNYALAAELDPTKDALLLEGSASPYANVVSSLADRTNDPRIRLLVKTLQSPEMQAFIRDHYRGAVLPVQ